MGLDSRLRGTGTAAWLLIAAAGCEAPPADGAPRTAPLRIGGSDTMARSLIPALVSAYSKKSSDPIEVTGGGSGAGLRQLLDGTLDIAAASTKHRAADEEQAKLDGFSLDDRGAQHIIGVDVVAVVVHEDSPIEALTYDQVIGIFCDKSIDDLAFLGQAQQGLRPIARDLQSGSRALFEDFFCGPRGIHHRVESASNDAILQALGGDETTITFSTMTSQAGKVVALIPDPEGDPIAPSQSNIANGRYPLYRDMYLYTAGPAAGPSKAFVDWVLTPSGQEVVDEQHFVPIYHRSESFDGPRPLRETIHFDVGASSPNQRSVARMQLLVQELAQRAEKGKHIVLEGFTDSKEADALALSEQRAEIVRDMLAVQLPGTFFEIIPRGSMRPLAPNATPYGRQRNRRVQIYLADEEHTGDEVVVDPSKSTPG